MPEPLTLGEVIRRLYNSEIDCGLQTFWDGGITIWLGGQMGEKTRRAEARFCIEDLDAAVHWLHTQASFHFPHSKYVREHTARAARIGRRGAPDA